ncbi:malonic semialdehyde reductase [Silvimonas sp.]|uniref:malonic semialdehyde reductase n=1 Tax=Silvimonas sp. TaxID=2650811 RepID=UPI00283C36B1|nr:malonic semialdehyde reductase [Silvimonas sp.]MDR3427491.1 malonic semialdehyde reductase [Silvimonas sp.]
MTAPLESTALDQLFRNARSIHRFTERPVKAATLQQLYDLLKWGPTGFNAQPARYLFVASAQAKAQLEPALSAGNRDKTLSAPVNVIVAYDTRFHEHLPSQFPAYDAKGFFDGAPAWIEPTARTNATLQAGYLFLAARALGLDVGPMSGFKPDVVDAAFFPDGRYKSILLANLGYGDRAELSPRGPRLDFAEVAQVL